MNNKIFKKFPFIKIILGFSLLINFIFISKTLNYERIINENMTRSIRAIEGDLEMVNESLSKVINSEEINELEYSDIIYRLESFDEHLKNLYMYHHRLGSNVDGFSFPDFIRDMSESILVFGEENDLSLCKDDGDDITTINLTKKEIKEFNYLKNNISKVLNVFSTYEINYDGVIGNWIEVMDEAYELRPNR